MCLAVPGVIEGLSGEWAKVRVQGVVIDTNVALIPEARVGDYVLAHAGYAIQLLSPQEAAKTFSLLEEISEFQAQLDEQQ